MYRRHFLSNAAIAVAATVALPAVSAVPAPSRAPVGHPVTIAGFAFSPATLSVRPGDRVTWINKDIVPHTATAADASWTTGELAPDQQAEIVIEEGFLEDYFCAFHPSMKAQLDLM